MQYNGRMAEMVTMTPQLSFPWHLYQVGKRWGQSRALHPHSAAERTRYSSRQSLKSWEPDPSFPSHSQMRSNIRKDKTPLRSVFILYFIHLSDNFFYVLCFSATPRGFASIICYSLGAWDSWDIPLSSHFLILPSFSHQHSHSAIQAATICYCILFPPITKSSKWYFKRTQWKYFKGTTDAWKDKTNRRSGRMPHHHSTSRPWWEVHCVLHMSWFSATLYTLKWSSQHITL